MVTNTDGYIHIIEYLTEHLSLFENSCRNASGQHSVIETIELELSEQIISMCSQNEALTANQRNEIIKEIDVILHDLEELLSGMVNNISTPEQIEFIQEFCLLIKNLFDAEIHEKFLS